jgi:hypothetical protein
MLLLDTNVVSELRKVASGKADPNVVVWNETVDPAETFISAVVLHELEIGVPVVEHNDAVAGRCFATGSKPQPSKHFLGVSCRWTRRQPLRPPNGMCPVQNRSMTPILQRQPSPDA